MDKNPKKKRKYTKKTAKVDKVKQNKNEAVKKESTSPPALAVVFMRRDTNNIATIS